MPFPYVLLGWRRRWRCLSCWNADKLTTTGGIRNMKVSWFCRMGLCVALHKLALASFQKFIQWQWMSSSGWLLWFRSIWNLIAFKINASIIKVWNLNYYGVACDMHYNCISKFHVGFYFRPHSMISTKTSSNITLLHRHVVAIINISILELLVRLYTHEKNSLHRKHFRVALEC